MDERYRVVDVRGEGVGVLMDWWWRWGEVREKLFGMMVVVGLDGKSREW